jgi:hypothetical protein
MAENMADKMRKGRHRFRPKKLTAELAERIRREPGLQREVAARFGVNQTTVSRLRLGKSWQHPEWAK